MTSYRVKYSVIIYIKCRAHAKRCGGLQLLPTVKSHRFIEKIINDVMSRVIYCLIFSILYKTFRKTITR